MFPVQPEAANGQIRCPHCRTTRLKALRRIDPIDRVYGNWLVNRMRARRGDTIYHCIYCRLQFYDPRKPAIAGPAKKSNSQPPQPSV